MLIYLIKLKKLFVFSLCVLGLFTSSCKNRPELSKQDILSPQKSEGPACISSGDVLKAHPEFAVSTSQTDDRPNIIILMIDALRADHLGSYGYERDTSPFIDSIAKEGALFRNAFVHSTQTVPSIASLFTGTTTMGHGVLNFVSRDSFGGLHSHSLHPDNLTIAELLRQSGYRTGAFVANPLITKQSGYNQGFQKYMNKEIHADQLHADAMNWILEDFSVPFFTYIHYMDVHSPYEPGKPYNAMFGPRNGNLLGGNGRPEQLIDPGDLEYTLGQYDGVIRQIDGQISLLWKELDKRELSSTRMFWKSR